MSAEQGPGEQGPGGQGPGEQGPGEQGPGEQGPGEQGPGEQGPSEPGGAPTPAEAPGGDDVRRRFEEALERKRRGHAGGTAEDGGRRGPALHSSTGPAKQQRTFRRKSG